MFNPFKKKTPECPVHEKTREWIEQAFAWLRDEFGEDVIVHKKTLLPNPHDFPIVYNGTHESATDTMVIVAKQMDIDPDDILLQFYSEGISDIGTGGMDGGKVYVDHEKDAKKSSGKYYGKNEDGKYRIELEENNLKDPVCMVATLAHEFAHIKLLGEERLEDNNEHLTDLTTVIYGLGVFNANTAFRYNSGFDSWSYQKLGYLTQIEWGYALAVYSYMRKEASPDWIKSLSETVKGNFRRGVQFIAANPDKMLC